MTFPAMIFAAGFGTRMGALTKDMPKPMVPLAGRPMIDHTIDLVKGAQITRIVANTHYLHDKIEPHLSANRIEVCREKPDILDTGGGLKAALPQLGSDVVITINPDAVWLGPNPIQLLIEAWSPSMQALLMLVPLRNAETTREAGDFSLEQRDIQRKGNFLYAGAQIIKTTGLSRISDTVFSLNRYWDLLADDGPLNGIAYGGRWCDIGTPDGLARAERLLEDV